MAPLALRASIIKPLRASAHVAVRSGATRRSLVIRNFRESDSEGAPAKNLKEDLVTSFNTTTEEITAKVVAFWENSEDKPTLVALGAGSILALYFANSVVGAVDRLPIFAGLFELVGIFFSGWTAYRFFLVDGEKDKMIGDVKGFVSKIGF